MGSIWVCGKGPLTGETAVQGSKNAALPLIAASVLHRGVTVLHNCPDISDVAWLCRLLEMMGCGICREGASLMIDASYLKSIGEEEACAGKLRASVLLLGSLLARMGEVTLPYPGGCVIGSRPVDYHLDIMRKLGAEVWMDEENICLKSARLLGTEISLKFPSVGATENGILAAVLAEGTTRLSGCAVEPEIWELCRFLNEKGARILCRDDEIVIEGVEGLRDSEYTLMPDRITAGTYLLAAAGTKGRICLHRTPTQCLGSLMKLLESMGARIRVYEEEGVRGKREEDRLLLGRTAELDCRSLRPEPVEIHTAPYPGFPTDLQSQLMAALTLGEGRKSMIWETMFEERFQAAAELRKMGADIRLDGKRAQIWGVKELRGAVMEARELRGGAALVIGGLMAQGVSRVENSGYLKRGYEDICRDLRDLGAAAREEL